MIAVWNGLRSHQGLYATYSFSAENHNGLPQSDLVMSEANSLRQGAYRLAPGYA
jgi:branched-chain amino acid transport system substrate-binding protein